MSTIRSGREGEELSERELDREIRYNIILWKSH